MEQINNEYFDLQKLIKQNDIDVRHLAETEPSLLVGEFFDTISKFLGLAPEVLRALGRFAKRVGEREDCKKLDSMINLLEALGCEKFIVEFHGVLDSYLSKGNWRLAATYATGVKDGFSDFYLRVSETKKKDDAAAMDGVLTLREAIHLLDEEKANRKPMILAVDDSPVILQSVWAILGSEYKVLTLTNPLETEKILQKQTPDLILLDYQMPELNGFELIPIIRSFDEHKDTPIVFLTSDRTLDNVTAALALGAKDYIVKPFKPETLREKVGKYI